ncbi:MAG: glycosyltransferase family 1 protein [Candidatus Omnitrophota bacterium]
MKIGIDIRSTLKRKTGIGYYTLNLINSLAKTDNRNEYYLYSEIGLFNRKKKLPDLPGPNFRHKINRLKLDSAFILSGLDLICTSSYDLSLPSNTRLILVIHDLIHKAYPEGHTAQTVSEVESKLIPALMKADRIIVSSLTTRSDLLKFYRVDPDKIRMVYPGVNEDLFLTPDISESALQGLKDKFKINSPFILYVGTLEPRKNVEGLIEAYKILKQGGGFKYQLVIAGMRGWLFDRIFRLVDEYEMRDDIIFTDYLVRQDLKALYKIASVFVYPSFYEGVGLPVLEAFKLGVPVVTSNSSSLGEIAKDAAILIDPYKPEEMARAILKVTRDEIFKKVMIDEGLKKAKIFSWNKAAREMLGVFNECA